MNITTKQFQLLTDINAAWQLMTENHAPFFARGIGAPFFEYAITSTWMDTRYTYLNRFWLDRDKPVGFVFYENPVSLIFFHLLPGYEALAEEMVAYADAMMPGKPGEKEFVLFAEQVALREAAEKLGYHLEYTSVDWMIDLDKKELKYPLPEGFHFVDPTRMDPVKLAACTWKGFGHEDKGPFENWDGEDDGRPWNPQKSYLDIVSSLMAPPPHSTYEYEVIIADEKGDYVCYSGMCWVPENQLAYMEPLCTVPEYRGRGLAAAALSEHCRRLRPLGARYMTGGEDPFYQKVGYTDQSLWHHWKKHPE